MKSYANRWTQEEIALLGKYISQGKTRKQVAILLDRSLWSISTRMNLCGIKRTMPPRAPIVQMVLKSHLIDWYILGWRVSGFHGDICNLEWPGLAPPKYPAAMQLLMLRNADVLEAA